MVTCHPDIDPLPLVVVIPIGTIAKVRKFVTSNPVCWFGNVPFVSALPAASWLWR